jgi:cystathionine beta-lyase
MKEIKISVPPLSALQGRKSEKWRAFPPDILPMPFAVMDYEIADPIKSALISLVQNSDAGYLGNIPELGEALSYFARQRWGWHVDPTTVKIAPDVGVGVIEICRLLLQPGDKILINTPVYYNFYNWIKELHCEVVDAPLIENELRYSLDFPTIEAAYASGVKVHILCNPHNPVGAVFSKSDLSALADLAKVHGVRIMSDEIHAPLVYQGTDFTPFLSASESAREVGFAFLSATKAFNIAGLKCAQIVAQSEENLATLARLPLAVHSRASLFGAIASAVAYQECINWLDAMMEELDSSRNFLRESIESSGVAIGYRMAEASYFGWLDLRQLDVQGDIANRFITEGKIAIAPGNLYGPSGDGFIRVNFATSKEIIQDAVGRIVGVLEDVDGRE